MLESALLVALSSVTVQSSPARGWPAATMPKAVVNGVPSRLTMISLSPSAMALKPEALIAPASAAAILASESLASTVCA